MNRANGGVLTDEQLAAVRLSDEHSEWRVQTAEEWTALMSPENFSRIPHVMGARRTGVPAYFVT